jgi:hypothetical protein
MHPRKRKAVLDEIINSCYHASILTEEGHPTVFRIIFKDNEGSSPATRYLLREPVPFTQGELRQLAPVADPWRVLIAVEQSGGRLQIYGLIDVGMTLWQMARHERVWGYLSPETLIVMSTRPGNMSTRPGKLSISRGDSAVLRMRDGEIVRASQSVVLEGPIAEFFYAASEEFIHNACKMPGINQDPDEDNRLSFAYQ